MGKEFNGLKKKIIRNQSDVAKSPSLREWLFRISQPIQPLQTESHYLPELRNPTIGQPQWQQRELSFFLKEHNYMGFS